MSFTKRWIDQLQEEGKWPEPPPDDSEYEEWRQKAILQAQEYEKKEDMARSLGIPPELI